MRLEQFLADKDVPLADTAAQRARAFGPGKYIVVDPVTLCIPLLLGYLRGSFNMQDTAGFRCRAVLASIHALTAYGLELSRLIREHLSAPLQAEAEPYLVEWPFPFIPDGMRSTLSAGLTGIDPGQIVARRIEKEQASRMRESSARVECASRVRESSARTRVCVRAPDTHTHTTCAGRLPGGRADETGAGHKPRDSLSRTHGGRGWRAPLVGHGRAELHAAPPAHAEHAGRRVRPGGVPGPAPAARLSVIKVRESTR